MTNNKGQPYREGDQETGDEKVLKVPITAFLVLMTPEGTVDVVTALPGLEVQRVPTVQDVRTMTRVVSDDAQARITALKASEGIARSLASVVSSEQRSQNLANMMIPGVPPGMQPRAPHPAATPDLRPKGGRGNDEG
jgi:hypothetical protein